MVWLPEPLFFLVQCLEPALSPRVTVWPTCMESRKAWPLFLSPYFFMYTHCPQLIASPCPFHQSSSHARYFPSMIRFTLSCRRLFHCLPHPFQFTTHSFLIQPPPDIASGIPLPPFHPDASHPEAARRYSIRTSRTRKPSAVIPFEHPPHLESFPAMFHLFRVSRIQNPIRSMFHLPRVSRTRNPIL